MIRRPPRSTLSSSSAASDVYKRQRSLFSAARGCGHVELKAAPDQLYLVAVVEAGQGRFEAALPDVAPRADNVGPDFNFQVHDGTNSISDHSLPRARTPAPAFCLASGDVLSLI